MNAPKKKIRRKVVPVRCRKSNSMSNRSLSSSLQATSSVNYKRRLSAMSKNNKKLALALQNARSELSRNRNLIEVSAEYLSKIKLARLKMLDMHSFLKSFMNDFDETILLLKVDDSKWCNFGSPIRPCRARNRMLQIIESVEGESEKVFVEERLNLNPETTETDEISSNQVTSNVDSTSKVSKEVMKRDDHAIQDCTENVSSTQSVDVSKSPLLSKSDWEYPKAGDAEIPKSVLTTEDEDMRTTENEDPKTPKLCLSLQKNADLDVPPESKIVSSSENRSSPYILNISKISTNPSTAQTSKIPRLPFLSERIKKTNFSKNSNKVKTTCKRKLVQKETELNSNLCRRKTFVVKGNETSLNPELSASVNKNLPNLDDILDENVPSTSGESKTVDHRKTFVVKSVATPEDTSDSESDRRKTFIKKSSNQSESAKSKRHTFIIPIGKEDINQTENSCHVPLRIETDTNLQSNFEGGTHSPIKEKLISVENSKESHDVFNKADISAGIHIPSQIHSKEIENHEILLAGEQCVDHTVVENSEKIKTSVDYDVDNKINEVESIETINVNEDDLPKNVKNDVEVIDISSSDTYGTRQRMNVSYKLFLESSESECESIPDVDLNFVNEKASILLKKCPVRRCISSTKKKKVFVFHGQKSKAPEEEKRLKKRINSKTSVNSSKNAEISLSDCGELINNMNMENQNKNGKSFEDEKSLKKCINSEMSVNSSKKSEIFLSDGRDLINNVDIDNPNKKKIRKTVNFSFDEKMQKNKSADYVNSDSCSSEIMQKISRIAADEVKNKDIVKKKRYKISDAADKNCFPSNISNCIYNKDLLEIRNAPEVCRENSLVITTNEKNTDTEEKLSENNKENYPADNTSHKCTDVASYAKHNTLKDDILIDELLPAAKKTKRNLNKKLKKKVCCVVEAVTSNDVENGTNNLREVESPQAKAKKRVKGKVRKEVPLEQTGKNTFLVHAEVHPPPPTLNVPEIENPNKENEEEVDLRNFQVSVVLRDIFKSENGDPLNVTHEKDFLLPSKTCPPRTPFSDNAFNIIPVESAQSKDTASVTKQSEVVLTTRRRNKAAVSYKEPSLNRKLRR